MIVWIVMQYAKDAFFVLLAYVATPVNSPSSYQDIPDEISEETDENSDAKLDHQKVK
jgi:hypothetical protein